MLPAVRWIGAFATRVARATVVIDPYAVAWTYFFDASGRALMRRNESTGNVTWFNYNAEGLPTAVGYPTGERNCFRL